MSSPIINEATRNEKVKYFAQVINLVTEHFWGQYSNASSLDPEQELNPYSLVNVTK